MKNAELVLASAVYVIGALVTFGAALAHLQRKYPIRASENFRGDVAFAVLNAIVPLAWIVVLLISGLYEHGFQFSRRRR